MAEIYGGLWIPEQFVNSRFAGWLLAVVCLCFLVVRAPVMYLQPGGQDEDCYAVPGFTILQTGIPQLPHVPARNAESVYYRADEALYSEPPVYFYYQAIFYLILPALYGTARLASAFVGVALLVLVYRLCRRCGCSTEASLWSVAFLSFSRWFYFPATAARPDILCAAIGIAVVVLILRWQDTGRLRILVASGIAIGLGGLTHPFAVVYAVQAAVWVMVCSRGWKRIGNPMLLASVSVLTCGLWLPLIRLYPETFRVQFVNQFLSDPGPPIWWRAAFPLDSLRFHAGHLWPHAGALQWLVTVVGLVTASLCACRAAHRRLLPVCLCAWSSIYLLSISVGTHHPTLGYWIYFAASLFRAWVCWPRRPFNGGRDRRSLRE
ncbi:MAG: glycosyltransferase family 39 protein [Planctomycetaceae bacterium]